MKYTLRDALESEISKMIQRCNQLEQHIKEYVEEGRLEFAAVSQIKLDTFKLVIYRLQEVLNNN